MSSNKENLNYQSLSTSSNAAGSIIRALSQSSRERLSIFAKIFIWCFTAGLALSISMPYALGKDQKTTVIMTVLCLIMLVLSSIVYFATRIKKLKHEKLLLIGSAYVIAGCLAMAIAEVVLLQANMRDKEGISGICVWLIMFPLIIPTTPKRSLTTALIAASMLPLSYFIGVEFFDVPTMRINFLIDWFSAVYFCVGLSYAAASCVYKWGTDIAKAQNELKKLGSYELLEEIGEGGMGVVWRARHRALAREAAIKLIHTAQLSDMKPEAVKETLELFEKEAQAIALLQSPHTISLYDFGATKDGNLYYAMELLDGPDLSYLVEHFGPQPPARVAQIIAQVCLSLGEAHTKQLIHRDVKPANIMLCQLGRPVDFVKVLDFGLVKLFKHAQNKNPEEGVTGTAAFIAPESVLLEKLSPATDIYSLGCVAYWLLTGTTVFKNETIDEDLVSHVEEAVELPSIRLGQALPEDLEAIIMTCLEKKPDGRFQNAEGLRYALEKCDCYRDWTEQDSKNWWLSYEQYKATKKKLKEIWGATRILSVNSHYSSSSSSSN